MKPPNSLFIYAVLSILIGANTTSPFSFEGVGFNLRTFVYAETVPAADKPVRQSLVDISDPAKRIVKRSMDIVSILLLSPFWVPVFAVLSLGILMEQIITWDFGPLLIKEERFSSGGKFNLYKMNVFREHARQRYIRESEDYKKEPTFNFLQSDPESLRYTGRLMKKFYLDELGQVFNILNGEMSLVGPRPHPIYYETNFKPPRQSLKPGIFCYPANRHKSGGDAILTSTSDEDYLAQYRNSSTWGLIKLDVMITMDGIRAVLKGTG